MYMEHEFLSYNRFLDGSKQLYSIYSASKIKNFENLCMQICIYLLIHTEHYTVSEKRTNQHHLNANKSSLTRINGNMNKRCGSYTVTFHDFNVIKETYLNHFELRKYI